MTTRYVAKSLGNDAWDGLAPVWTAGLNGPKASLTAMEATPVTPGDLIHVKGGLNDVYRETLTVGVSGTAGNAIEYRGDYKGLIWPGASGIVRITGSNDDKVMTRGQCITANTKHYRTFNGLHIGLSTQGIRGQNGCNYWTVDNCAFADVGMGAALTPEGDALGWTIRRCAFLNPQRGFQHIVFYPWGTGVANSGHLIESCIFLSTMYSFCIQIPKVGGATIRNCFLFGSWSGIYAYTLPVGYTANVANNNQFIAVDTAVQAGTLGELVENYNNFFQCNTNRLNVAVGANSVSYAPLLDTRWFFEAVNAGRMVTPFDLSEWSQIINLAGTSPPATDMRGTGVIGAQREWGTLEYDPTLLIESAAGGGMLKGEKRGGKQ